MRIYTDLDETLIANVHDAEGNSVDIIPRPGVSWFLRTLSQHGSLWLITYATMPHVRQAFKKLGSDSKLFRGIISRETMAPVEEQIKVVLETPGISEEYQFELWNQIKPIAKPGIVFDDFPIMSSLGALKSKSVGIMDDQWIQVEPSLPGVADRQGLKRAYSEFVARFGSQGTTLGRKRTLAWL
jgi:hypothetical protein